jgi:CspA family cold shock protein
MFTGRVKWFNNAKGYGFIETTGTERDIFVHYSAITGDGYRTLRQGQVVRYELADGPKGPAALNVESVAEEPAA